MLGWNKAESERALVARAKSPERYAAVGGPNQVVSASGSPGWVRSPTQADISVGPDQHGGGSSDRAECRKLPRTDVFGVDQLNPIRPWSDVEAAGLTEVE